MNISHVSNPSSSSPRPDYQVFLSFRGPDTRRTFADFLYTSLTGVGIRVFRDEEDLEKGKEMNPQLIQAIEQSKISIPVISKEYASSKSCLMELKEMVKCMDGKNHTIIPIFYYVNPSDVQNCTGPVKMALNEHKKRGRDDSILNPWKSALQRIGDLTGHHLHENQEKKHGEFIKLIVRKVEQMLQTRDLILPKQLVVVNPHVQEIMAKLKVDYRDGQEVEIGDTCEKVLLIHGIPGIGKTVLAKCVYNKLNHLFDACSFLEKFQEEIRDHSIVSVQNRLISHLHKENAQTFDCSDFALKHIESRFCAMKVLLLLDNVKDREQLSALVGELDWLGPGSRVIVTSQRDDVLKKVKGAEKFGLTTMQQDEALKLFCWHAFGRDSSPEELGSWQRKSLLLLMGFLWRLRRSWVEIGENKELCMGGILKAFGKEIVKSENKNEPCQRSRLWNHEEALDVLTNRKGTKFIGALGLEFADESEGNISFQSDQFDRLWSLRFLKLDWANIQGNSLANIQGYSMGYISSLRWLHWHHWRGCTKIMKSVDLDLQNLVIFDLSRSRVHVDWRGWKLFSMASNLKVLKLTGCTNLTSIPKFPKSWGLERLILEGCSNLAVINLSINKLEKLISLNLKGCSLLNELPDLGPLTSLKELVIDGTSISRINFQEGSMMKLKTLSARNCKDLTDISDSIGYLKSLKYLSLDGSGIHTLPESIGSLEKLKTLSLKNCQRLTDLPDGIGGLRSLQFLDLSYTEIKKLPTSVDDLKAMEVLRMRGTFIQELPETILNREKPVEIDISLCQELEAEIHFDIERLSSFAIMNER
ncbi:disease resistance protein RPV1 [Eucalyptus grandis]|uniref:disease resistance protein RPV1 n=1 Tax=Eucalyptus grandis TaxID=71139 RepID=UPI00192EACEF|nr:disease resistance protein RPV1 [Eucalyptus grandis]